ncbi:MAG: 50S ribosomal protein L31e [Candidatus Helarchaeota archaeon]|nr:50S ribosomal protein L31e [Candidatus Helarchaeota archaeon]
MGEILEERLYTVPLGRVKNTPRKKRTKRAVNMLREFVIRHMKPEGIIIDPILNEIIWERGIEKPPRKIRIRVTKDREGLVTIYPVD